MTRDYFCVHTLEIEPKGLTNGKPVFYTELHPQALDEKPNSNSFTLLNTETLLFITYDQILKYHRAWFHSKFYLKSILFHDLILTTEF